MANFQSGVQPVEENPLPMLTNPVDNSKANDISTFGNVLGVVGSTLAQAFTQGQQIKQAKADANVLGGYSQNLLRVADLEQQGVLKPDQALRRYRLLTAQMIANHPMLQDEIYKTYGNIVEKAGLGLNVAKDYQQQQDNANQLKMQALMDAQKAGWGSPNDPPEVQQQMAEKHQQFLFAQSQMEAANALLEHKIKENNLVSSGLQITAERQTIANQSISLKRNQIGLAQDQAKQQFLAGAKNLSDAYFSKWQQDTANIVKQVQAGQLKPEDAIKAIQQQQAAIHQQTGALAAAYDSQGSLEALTKPIDMLAQATIDQISGKTGSQVTENTVNNILGLKNIQLLSSDPKFLALTAVSKMIPAGAGALQQGIGDAAVRLLKQNRAIPLDPGDNPANFGLDGRKPGDITHNDDPDHNKGVEQYFSITRGAISNIRAGNNDPDLHNEVLGNIHYILRGIGVYSKTMASPSELNSAVKFFADPQVGSYMKDHPEIIKGDAAVMAKVAYEQDYQRAVLPLIQEEFLNSKVRVGEKVDSDSLTAMRFGPQMVPDERPTSGWIHPEFNGTGITFVPNDPSKGDVQREAQRLNREVAPVINNLIRANAHFAGTLDYKTSYENFMAQLQPNLEQDAAPVKAPEDVLREVTGVK